MNIEHQYKQDFEHVLTLIQDARDRAYNKANSELVLLYFNVGKIVSEKVGAGAWGEKTVQQLADYIRSKAPSLSGFSRRGLYRMKQFHELYTSESDVFKLWVETVSPVATQMKSDKQAIVSPTATQLEGVDYQHDHFMTTVLLQISWTNHLEVFSAVKQPEQILFYL